MDILFFNFVVTNFKSFIIMYTYPTLTLNLTSLMTNSQNLGPLRPSSSITTTGYPNVHEKNENAQTALPDTSNKNGHNVIVKNLLKKGAKIDKRDNDRSTALMDSCQNGHIDSVHTLINNGVNINEKKNHGWTALMNACQDGHTEDVKALLKNGSGGTINEKTEYGWTLLMFACCKGHIDIVRVLLRNGAEASLNEKNEQDGFTALMMACKIDRERTDIVKALLEKGASINVKNNDNETALDIARRKNHDNIKQLLECPPMSKPARM